MKTLKIVAIACIAMLSLQTQAQDQKAIKIAHKVAESMGGVTNWNNTHFIKWDFGKRILYWDKWTGDVRVEAPKDHLVVLVNINTLKGKAYKNKELVTDEKELKKLLNKGKRWWINDSYWLTMPWKLLDPGVNLEFVREDKLPNGNKADVLQLTFNEVGVTPNNKYEVYVDQKENKVYQWAFFNNFNDTKPKFIKPWDNYQKLGNVWLSFNRSDFGPKNVEVKESFNADLFSTL